MIFTRCPISAMWIALFFLGYGAIGACNSKASSPEPVALLSEPSTKTIQEPRGQVAASVMNVPTYLQRWPGLYVRQGQQIVEAPLADVSVAKAYPSWPDKGPVVRGQRLTIMTANQRYKVGQPVRVVHVLEAPEKGVEVYIMGPKEIVGEFINGRLVSKPVPKGANPLIPMVYDGAVLPSPAVDYNYDITTHTFDKPGTYEIVWRVSPWISNTLSITVVP